MRKQAGIIYRLAVLYHVFVSSTLRFIYFKIITLLVRKVNQNKQQIFIVALKGRLGNQLFQYAFAVALKAHYPNTPIKFDINQMREYSVFRRLQKVSKATYLLPKIFRNVETIPIADKAELYKLAFISTNIFIHIVKKFITPIFPTHIVHNSLVYKDVFLPFNQSMYFDGYWQSEKYFKKYRKEVLEHFLFSPFQEKENIELSKEIQSNNSISIHVRRGDYLLENTKKIYGDICTIDYYTKAIRHIEKEVSNPKFIVFSDDIDWCKDIFCEKENFLFVDWNIGDDSFRDMQLMSLCKHNIIANSSFSWWGAWLNDNTKKIVVAPNKWFNDNTLLYNIEDVIPQDWIKISV